jgi:hypothetical protein
MSTPQEESKPTEPEEKSEAGGRQAERDNAVPQDGAAPDNAVPQDDA